MPAVLMLLSILMIVLITGGIQRHIYHKRLNNIKIRILVDGIRGKSTVTRLIAGVLREAGYVTVGKTNGNTARILLPDGDERQSAPTIMELMNIVEKYTDKQTEAIVFESISLQPKNQTVSQNLLVRSNIGVITNVREDHQDMMGETLEEIADTLSLSMPKNGILITAENRPHLLTRLEQHARKKCSQLIYADPAIVSEKELAGFKYLSFKENIAIGLKVAEILGIPRNIAMRGMYNSRPDIGVVSLQRTEWKGKQIIWAPLFAVNDCESAILSVEALHPFTTPETTSIGILNNRFDRADRAMRFADLAAKDMTLDYWITFGAYENQVTDRMTELGFPRERIIHLGFSINPTLDQIFDRITERIKGNEGILIGLVNIHTEQAELLMDYFQHQPDSPVYLDNEYVRKQYQPRNEVVRNYLQRYLSHLEH